MSLDFSDVFDIVLQLFLVVRVEKIDVTEPLLSLLQNHLKNMMFRTKVNRVHVIWRVSTSVVSQGTILGSLLFLIFNVGLLYEISPTAMLCVDGANI